MSPFGMLYLAMVIGAALAFMGTLAWVSRRPRRERSVYAHHRHQSAGAD